MTGASAGDDDLLRRAAAGDPAAVNELFTLHRERLRWMVQLRLNRRLQGRIDPSDVLQEAYLETCQRLGDYLRAPRLPFFLWLRQITERKLLALHRHHLGTQMRDAAQEISLNGGAGAEPGAVAAELVGKATSPSGATMRAELQTIVQQALESMDAIDREVLVLRHFELLTNEEVAQVLSLTKSAASIRYVRALKRLRGLLSAFPGLFDGIESV